MENNIKITEHVLERYVERIKGIKNKKERALYIAENKSMLEDKIFKTLSHANLIYVGQIGCDKHTSKKYYLNGDICVVVDTEDKAIITLFRCEHGYPKETNKIVTKDLSNEIMRLEELLLIKMTEIEDLKTESMEIRDGYDIEIKELESKIEHIKLRKENEKKKMEIANAEIKNINASINKYATKLFGKGE